MRTLARAGWWALLLAIACGLTGGLLSVFFFEPSIATPPPAVDPCPEPPCFDLDLATLPPLAIPGLLWLLLSLFALLLALPSLLVGGVALFQGRWKAAATGFSIFIGQLLVLVGTEIVPHILLPCFLLPAVCEELPEYGLNVTEQWHQLDHMLVGAVPLALLYWLMLRRVDPSLVAWNRR